MKIALYQPDIPQNLGSILRICACLGVEAHVIEPCGFAFDDKRMKRAGMDYLEHVVLVRHASWGDFLAYKKEKLPDARLLLLTTKASQPYLNFAFQESDILLLGRESSGAPPEVHSAADARILIPMRPEVRSLNVANACAMVLGEALRQTKEFPAG